MKLTKAIAQLSLPHDTYRYQKEELYTFLSILMPGYKFKAAYDIRNMDYYNDTIDDLDDLVIELVELAKTNKIEDMQTGCYSSYDIDSIEDYEYYIRIIAYKMKE